MLLAMKESLRHDRLFMSDDSILPDLQSAILCEDVRAELSGQQTLVGVLGAIPTPRCRLVFSNSVSGPAGAVAAGISSRNASSMTPRRIRPSPRPRFPSPSPIS